MITFIADRLAPLKTLTCRRRAFDPTSVAPLARSVAGSNVDALVRQRTWSSGDPNFAAIVGSHVGNVHSSGAHPLKNKVHHSDEFGVLSIS